MFLLSCKGCPGFVEDDDGGDKNEDGDEGYEYDDDVDESDEEDVVVSDPMRLLAIHHRSENFSFPTQSHFDKTQPPKSHC